MVRLEKQGDSFVLVTGTAQKQDISVLVNAMAELQKNSPDRNKIKDGLLYLDNSSGTDIRKEIKTVLQKAIEYRELTITDL
ncbi:MAG: hypothetical protein O8C66_09960 [Candidatus Methanoperedens sp.]|nr:hypothetical protein [Candidatus Methanoperedens sp.]MCZ7370820.1 hypothetical protein [Candidatus Methanoperedens sp.]